MFRKSPIRNNFYKWSLRSIPYFVFLFFIFIILTVFMFQPASFFLQSRYGWNHQPRMKHPLAFSFADIYSAYTLSNVSKHAQGYKTTHRKLPSSKNQLDLFEHEQPVQYIKGTDTFQIFYDKD